MPGTTYYGVPNLRPCQWGEEGRGEGYLASDAAPITRIARWRVAIPLRVSSVFHPWPYYQNRPLEGCPLAAGDIGRLLAGCAALPGDPLAGIDQLATGAVADCGVVRAGRDDAVDPAGQVMAGGGTVFEFTGTVVTEGDGPAEPPNINASGDTLPEDLERVLATAVLYWSLTAWPRFLATSWP